MKITDLPLGEVPFLAIDRLMTSSNYDERYGKVPLFNPQFIPKTWIEDLKLGEPTALVYWYPQYIDYLYEIAMQGKNFKDFLIKHHARNEAWFLKIFPEVANKLERLASTSVKLNHLNETVIVNGRLKL